MTNGLLTFPAERDKGSAAHFGGLDFLWIELTHRCNLQCVHCYTDSHPRAGIKDFLGKNDYARILREARDLHCTKVQFIGGEPQLNRNLLQLIKIAATLGFEFIEVFSNLTWLNFDLVKLAVEQNVYFATSVYSDNPSDHDRITRVANSHVRTINNIRKLIERGVTTRVGIVDINQDEAGLLRTEEFLKNIGVSEIRVDRVRGVGRAGNNSTERRSISELCGACWDQKLCVSPDGTAFPCIMSRNFPIGSLLDQSLAQILDSAALRCARKQIHEHFSSASACSPDCVPNFLGQPPSPSCAPASRCAPSIPCGPDYPCGPTKHAVEKDTALISR
jgi:sulfatase maturation enzyme AslB (radical SAM superfamily)